MIEMDQALIPGLPDDVAWHCIARIPHRFHSTIRPVCRNWRDLVTSPSFLRHRVRVGAAEDLIFIVQALKEEGNQSVDPVTASEDKAKVTGPKYSLAVHNATLATWQRVPTPDSIPMFSQIAAVQGKVVLVGGWDPITLDPVADVRVLDLATMVWRRGSPMMSARSFFACAAAGGRVYVAGGHDGQKNALRSAEAYDVASDEWVSLPPMREERDESRGLIIGGKFWAVSGYSTENQGRFATSAEMFDPDNKHWTTVEGMCEDATCSSCFVFGETAMANLDHRGTRGFKGKEWGFNGNEGIEAVKSTNLCGSVFGMGARVIVTGGEGNGMRMMDLKSRKGVPVERPVGFSGSVYAAVAVRI